MRNMVGIPNAAISGGSRSVTANRDSARAFVGIHERIAENYAAGNSAPTNHDMEATLRRGVGAMGNYQSTGTGVRNIPSSTRTAEIGQRDKAKEIACSCPPGSLGYMICHNLNLPYVKIFGNVGAGKIGDYYESIKTELAMEATGERIRRFARNETEFFKGADWFTRFCAGLMTEKRRIEWLEWAKKEWQKGGGVWGGVSS